MSKFTTILISAVLMSFLFISCSSSRNTMAQKSKKTEYYTCPMHSDVIEVRPGKCPKCGMALVMFDLQERIQRNSNSSYQPLYNSGGNGGHSGGHH